MSVNDTATDNGHGDDQIDDCTCCALAERLTVSMPDGTPVTDATRTAFSVTSASGATYQLDLASGDCECVDGEYRVPTGGCKHVRCARLATSREAVPTTVDADPSLNGHVTTAVPIDGDVVLDAETPRAELVDDDDTGDVRNGPFTEYNRYGQPTGHEYIRCRSCGIEVISGYQRDATHHDDRPHGD